MKKVDLKDKTKKELEKMLIKSRKELLDLRMDNSMQKLKNPHNITLKRKDIARIRTSINSEEGSK